MIEFSITPKIRKNTKRKLEEYLSDKKIDQLEISIYDNVKLYCVNNNIDSTNYHGIYIEKVEDIVDSLKNTNLLERIERGDLKIKDLPSIQIYYLNQPIWDEELKRQELSNHKAKNLTYINTPCIKCKQKKVMIESSQTRSLDEGVTIKHRCQNKDCMAIQKT
jgi:DNA-directed RNA polymerase subunit M/transcription elongation factor TFIIS